LSIYSEDYTAAVETKIEIDEYADDEVNALPQAPRKSSRKTEFKKKKSGNVKSWISS
jgi:hypothetical protein